MSKYKPRMPSFVDFNNVTNDNKYFIHFETPGQLESFLKETKLSIGYKCCENKGAHLIGVNSYQEVNKLKRDFENRFNNTKSYTPNNNIKTYECPVCMEICRYIKKYPLSCKHAVCRDCINGIKNNSGIHNSCPICRKNF